MAGLGFLFVSLPFFALGFFMASSFRLRFSRFFWALVFTFVVGFRFLRCLELSLSSLSSMSALGRKRGGRARRRGEFGSGSLFVCLSGGKAPPG
ncbi:hypothetical protein R3P38DRAFT_2906578 [Favolaschia claudopus]|uniref:NADH dehydrogenase subunit 5 n=1 Tax=Favolaschia claudopus TaxID=2862362 RepID=A0AAW0CIH4_9AGAR